MATRRYKILVGKHVDYCPNEHCSCESAEAERRSEAAKAEAESRPVKSVRGKNHIYRQGEIVETASDLLKMNFEPTSIKFELLPPAEEKQSYPKSSSTKQTAGASV